MVKKKRTASTVQKNLETVQEKAGNMQLDEDDNPIMKDEYFQNRINTDHL